MENREVIVVDKQDDVVDIVTTISEKDKAVDALNQSSYDKAQNDEEVKEKADKSAKNALSTYYEEQDKDTATDSEIGEVKRDGKKTNKKADTDAEYCNRYRATLEKYHKKSDGLTKEQVLFWVGFDWFVTMLSIICGGWVLVLLKKLFDLTAKLGKGIWISIGVIVGLILIIYIIQIAIQLNGFIGSLPSAS